MKAVVFDMDGVLFDTEKLCFDSWCQVAEQQGIQDMEIVFPRCIGRNSRDTKEILLEFYGQDFAYEEFCKEASQFFKQYITENGMPMKPGVTELLRYLKGEGYAIGLASSTRYTSIVSHLQAAGISEYFSVIIGGDMVEHSKPEPDIYLTACERLGADPRETYAIEDSYNGIRAAHRAGMKPVMIPDMLPPDDEMRALSLVIFDNLGELITYFDTHEFTKREKPWQI